MINEEFFDCLLQISFHGKNDDYKNLLKSGSEASESKMLDKLTMTALPPPFFFICINTNNGSLFMNTCVCACVFICFGCSNPQTSGPILWIFVWYWVLSLARLNSFQIICWHLMKCRIVGFEQYKWRKKRF